LSNVIRGMRGEEKNMVILQKLIELMTGEQ
jgi:hypothetical protein